MLAALRKNRDAAPEVAPAGPDGAEAPEAAGPGDALLAKMEAIEAKLDKICAALNLDAAPGNEPAEKDGTEAPPDDNGY